jgi:hypothetical protein
MIDVALVDVESNDLCGLLIDCLQDVRFTVLVVLRLFTLLLNFDFSSLL